MSNVKSGFTLIELLVTVGVLSIIAGVSVTIFLSISAANNKAQVMTQLKNEGGRLVREVGNLVYAASNLEPGEITCVYGSNCESLKITLNDRSLEYQQNGNCKEVKIGRLTPAGANAYVYKSYAGLGCSSARTEKLTNDSASTGINVTSLFFNVNDGGLTKPDQVRVSLSLEQSVSAPKRGDFEAQVSQESEFSTRSY